LSFVISFGVDDVRPSESGLTAVWHDAALGVSVGLSEDNTGVFRGSRETLVKENVNEKGKEHWRRPPF
jgi:hypothetical protein